MKLKDKVLEKLYVCKSQYISGQSIAEEFSVTRNAVWKAINTLKGEGHNILSSTQKGYCLSPKSDTISAFGIKNYLTESAKYHIEILPSVNSTNNYLIDLAKKRAKEWTVIVAEEQTQGKGRQKRSFFSPKGDGVYLSVLLRPTYPIEDASMITVMTAAAVTEILEEKYNFDLKIKWVNDIFKDGKKVCGILTEGSLNVEEGVFDYLVVGIGINLTKPQGGYPKELESIIAPLFDYKLNGKQKNNFIADVLENIYKHYSDMKSKKYLEYYQKKQYLIGKEVDVYQADKKTAFGKVIGVDDKARLMVETNGKIEYFSSGEARVITK